MKTPFVIRAALNIQADEGSQRKFNILAYSGGKLNVPGFPLPVVIDLAGLDVRAGLPILIDHENAVETTLGQVSEAINDGRQLVLRGAVTGVSSTVQAVLSMAARGHQWEASIGAVSESQDRVLVDAGQVATVNGQEIPGPFILARRALLRETSVLPMGADPSTRVNLAASAKIMKGAGMPTFEEWLTSLGLDPATLTQEAIAALQVSYQAGQAPAAPVAPAAGMDAAAPAAGPIDAAGATDTPADGQRPQMAAAAAVVNVRAAGQTAISNPVAAIRAGMADEVNRVSMIRARCAGNDTLIEAAIRQGWDADRAELEMRRQADRSRAPAGHVRSHEGTCTLQALQGAMILRAGGRLDDPAYQSPRALAMNVPQWLRANINAEQRQRAMEAAWNYREMSMVDLAREAVRLDGREAPVSRTEMIQAAFSGGTLTSIFTTNVNTQILSTYEEIGDSTEGWTQETEAADFKTNERPRMLKGPSLAKLPRGGTADHISRADVGETFKVARYARQFQIDEQDVIDDSFNALADTPAEMGMAAARLRPDLVYSILLANPNLAATARALFNTTDGNLGSSSALAAATLKTAIQSMFLLQENGVNLGLQADHIIVPPSLEFTAYELLQSPTIVIAGTAGSVTERGSMNTLTKKTLKVVVDPRLENGVIDPDSGTTYNGSSTTWYIACAIAHTILVAYLRGTGRSPQVRSYKLDKGQWGVGWDVKLDIGAKAMDWKGLRKTTA